MNESLMYQSSALQIRFFFEYNDFKFLISKIDGALIAEKEGFEPSVQSPVHMISSQAHSTALAFLRMLLSQSYIVDFTKLHIVFCHFVKNFVSLCEISYVAL